jgi:hypothetical protein
MKIITLMCIFLFLIYFIFTVVNTYQPFKIDEEVTLSKFNEMFNSSIVHLPLRTLIAVGFKNNILYIYNKPDIISDSYISFKNYFIDEILPNIKKISFYFVVCLSDGYMDGNKFSSNLMTPYYPSNQEFYGVYSIKLIDHTKYPIFHKNKIIFTYCKYITDPNSILIPDKYFISTSKNNINNHFNIQFPEWNGYKDLFKMVDNNRLDFNEKKSLCVWRGNTKNGYNSNFFKPEGKNGMNQRMYFVYFYNKGAFQNIDYSDSYMSISNQMKYKYILSIDGWSNQWDATAWKLYSGSVLLKVKSVWEQWFYPDFKEWVHYVPIENDFSDLNEKIEWCINNDKKCKEIAENARQFAITTYNWENAKNYTIDAFNKYL